MIHGKVVILAAAGSASLLAVTWLYWGRIRSEKTILPSHLTPDIERQLLHGRIAVCEYGPTTAPRVLLYFHGLPGSRYVPVPHLSALCHRYNVRLVSFDRPGIGKSDYNTELLTVVQELLKLSTYGIVHPQTKSIEIIAYSLGVPSALSVIPELVQGILPLKLIHLIAPVGFTSSRGSLHNVVAPNLVVHTLSRYAPWFLRTIWYAFGTILTHGNGYIDSMIAGTSSGDRKLLNKQDIEAWRLANRETWCQGVRAFVDSVLGHFGKDAPDGWGFSLSPIGKMLKANKCSIQFYHGRNDIITPLCASQELMRIMAISTGLHVYPNDVGHFTILKEAIWRIIQDEDRLHVS